MRLQGHRWSSLGALTAGCAFALLLAGAGPAAADSHEARAWDLDEKPYAERNLPAKVGTNVRDGLVGVVNSFGQGLFSAARVGAPFGGSLGQKAVTFVGDVVGLVDNNLVTDRVLNGVLSRHLLRYGAGARSMPEGVAFLHDSKWTVETPTQADFVGPATLRTNVYLSNSSLATLGAIVISDVVVRPVGKIIMIFGGRGISEDADEWGKGLIESAAKVPFI
jgi:hypothetical protein